jgi:hypothetical protein
MPTTIQITTDNYDGQTAIITFTPDNGGPVVNLGSQVLPYDYISDYFYGTYSLYFPLFDTTCTLVIENQSPSLCFEYIGQGPNILYQCSVQAQPTLYNGRYYWVLNGCPTDSWYNYPVCPTIDNNNYIWWDNSKWNHTSSLGGGYVFTTLTNPGLLPIEILGTYEWTSMIWGTCFPEVRNSTLGSCLPLTPTPTPSITPTMTPTPTPTPTPVQTYYVYRFCNTELVQYVVQTLPGFTIIPGKVLRYGVDYGFPIGILYFCSEFLYVTNTPTFPPGTNVTNYTGNFFTIINPGAPTSPFNNCTDCLSYVEPPPVQSYSLVGPYGSSSQACIAGNLAGGALGTATFTNGITIGSQVYNTPLFGTTQLVTTPGWYAAAASFISIYSSFRIDNTGTIVEIGNILCF